MCFIYTAVGGVLLYTHLSLVNHVTENAWDANTAKYFGLRYYPHTWHGMSMFGGFFLFGFSIMIFRIMKGAKTFFVMCIHVILYVITLLLFIYGWIESYHDAPISCHQFLGYQFLGSFFLEVCESCYLFVFGNFKRIIDGCDIRIASR